MPLSGLDLKSGNKNGFYSVLKFVLILCEKDLESLFDTQNTEFERLIHTYPGVPNSFKPSHVANIMKYCLPKFEKDILIHFQYFENYMYALGKRDHLTHQFETFILGLHILKMLIKKSPSRTQFGFDNEIDIYKTWLLTSFGHDFGYPIEISKQLFKELSVLFKNFYLDSFSSHIDTLLNNISLSSAHGQFKVTDTLTLTQKIKNVFYTNHRKIDCNEFVKKSIFNTLDESGKNRFSDVESHLFESKDHGYFSALLLLFLFLKMYIYESDNNIYSFNYIKEKKELEYAAGAIGLHNISEFFINISFDNNPYAYLLALIDNIQDWNRSIFTNDKYPEYTLQYFDVKENSITLNILITLNDYSNESINHVLDYLNEKESLIHKCLNVPHLKKEIKIFINYYIAATSYKRQIIIIL